MFVFQGVSVDQSFLQACEMGNMPTVKKIIADCGKSLNYNCTDFMGRTPLQLAVENEHESVRYFLNADSLTSLMNLPAIFHKFSSKMVGIDRL